MTLSNQTTATLNNIFYTIVLPLTTVLLLLVVSPRQLGRIPPFYSVTRFLLCIWFSGLYIILANISKYRIYPNIRWKKSDVGKIEKWYLLFQGLAFGLMHAGLTYLVVQKFLPGFGNFRIFIALLNGIIIAIPPMAHFWVLKL